MSKKHGAAFSVEGGGGAGVDCVEGMGSSHVLLVLGLHRTGGAEAAVVSGATGGLPTSGGVIGRRPSRPRRGDRALLGSG
jgi:hypothetical protein